MTDVLSAMSRPVSVTDIPPEGVDVTVEARPEEREALARDFKLPAVHSLTGTFHVSGTRSRVHVSGRVDARIEQICVVTLDPFDSTLEEDVEVDFAESSGMPPEPPTEVHEYEPPDEIVNGQIDLGSITAEFLVLGLDPYPRKPGVDFEYKDDGDSNDSPFAALGKLKRD